METGFDNGADKLNVGKAFDQGVASSFPVGSHLRANRNDAVIPNDLGLSKNYPPSASSYTKLAQISFAEIAKNKDHIAITSLQGSLKGRATKGPNQLFFISDPTLFIKWVKAEALQVSKLVSATRQKEGLAKAWGAARDAFKAELDRLQLARQAALKSGL